MNPIMIIEPAATVSEQITGNSSRAATRAARPLIAFLCAKRHPATPIQKLRLAPAAARFECAPFAAFFSQFDSPLEAGGEGRPVGQSGQGRQEIARDSYEPSHVRADWEENRRVSHIPQLTSSC